MHKALGVWSKIHASKKYASQKRMNIPDRHTGCLPFGLSLLEVPGRDGQLPPQLASKACDIQARSCAQGSASDLSVLRHSGKHPPGTVQRGSTVPYESTISKSGVT
eukprot:1158225-Pelagomonas_calceolata.AAC.2